jgi:hypothetical protein
MLQRGEGRGRESERERQRERRSREDLAMAERIQTMSIADMAMIKVRLTTVSTTLSFEGGVLEFNESLVSLPV